jgi:L,D-peptidoglycan transpeptidase YkuD (ErfK/YbiS/YcfS/YnhG family)
MRGAALAMIAVLVAGCGGAPAAGSARSTSAAPPVEAPDTAPAAAGPSPSPSRTATTAPKRQLITVSAASYSATTATLTAYESRGGTWTKVLGPWTAHIGKAGLAKPGAKREGDLHTPSGTFPISYMFGWKPDPGVKFRYRVAHGYDTWSDDSASPYYNLWVDSRKHDPGAAPEQMDGKYYAYGVVIGYNTDRTPHRGSAVFLHVDHASPTTGCVTLPTARLLKVMRWLDPARSPQIKIGVA